MKQSGRENVPGMVWRSWHETKIQFRPDQACLAMARYIEAAVKGVLIASITCPMAIRSPAPSLITSSPGSSA